MNLDIKDFIRRYSSALQDYLSGSGEVALEEAYEIGRSAVQTGLGVLDIAVIHQQCLLDMLLEDYGPQASRQMTKLAGDFLLESLSQYEITHRGYQDANQALQQLNQDLNVMNRQVEYEREQSEGLLLNILPKPIADRIKHGEVHLVDYFSNVSVMFADIVGFTGLSRLVSERDLIDWLEMVFAAFDQVLAKYRLEKLKTIGDGYMLAVGVPNPIDDCESLVAEVALDIMDASSKIKSPLGDSLQIRIGLNCGPVIAGVIGTTKFAYDIWGETVNAASRMESYGVPGHIQVNEAMYRKLDSRYLLQKRGRLMMRGMGMVTAYFLLGRRDYASSAVVTPLILKGVQT